jgi:hypothetical protein
MAEKTAPAFLAELDSALGVELAVFDSDQHFRAFLGHYKLVEIEEGGTVRSLLVGKPRRCVVLARKEASCG